MPSAAPPQNVQGQVTSSTHSTIDQCMLHAHFINTEFPGTYEEEVNIMFKASNLPTIKVPRDPPSARTIARLQQAEEVETYEEAVEEMEEKEPAREEGEAGEREQAASEEGKKHTGTKKKGIKESDVGLTVYTSEFTGWPQGKINEKQILKGIKEKKYKYIYRDDNVNDTEVLVLIEGNAIDLTNCFAIEEDSVFNRIRSGLLEEKTRHQRINIERKICKEVI